MLGTDVDDTVLSGTVHAVPKFDTVFLFGKDTLYQSVRIRNTRHHATLSNILRKFGEFHDIPL